MSSNQRSYAEQLPATLRHAQAELRHAALVDEHGQSVASLDQARYFLHALRPRRGLIIVGAVHVAQVLAQLAPNLGWQSLVIDPRKTWASPSRFPTAKLHPCWPQDIWSTLLITADTAIVCLSHDEKIDDPALIAALESPAFYVGALGSARTHAKRCARLAEKGVSTSKLERLHAPIGLPIGAAEPGEIACAILAQMIARFRSPAETSRS